MSSRRPNERSELLEQAIRLKKAAARSSALEISSRPADQEAHLSDMQRSLWLVHQMMPESTAYNLTSVFRTRDTLNVHKLQRALNALVSRHRLLRSTFSAHRDTVEQIVHPHSPLAVEMLEVEAGEGLRVAAEEARKPFDLQAKPLIRLLLIEEVSNGVTFLVLVLHHILADERSLGILWDEFAEAYEGQLSDAEPRAQYDDYVHWLSLNDTGQSDEEIERWRQWLEPLPGNLVLPFEKPATKTDVAKGQLLSRTLSAAVQERVRHLAAATGASPFMVYTFAFRLLLQRYTQGQSFAFATPVSTRSHPAAARMIGYFLNPVVIAAVVDEEQPVDRAVRDFGHKLRDALMHASVPFHRLAEVLSPPRHADRHPIFQAMFVYQEKAPPLSLGGARLEPVVLDLGASKFDLSLFVTEGESSLEIAAEYRADRYDENWMQGLLRHYEALLESLPEDLDRATADVPMMRPQELTRLLADSTGTTLDQEAMALAPHQILRQASQTPQSVAVVCDGLSRTFSELVGSARSIARELMAGDVRVGDRVGVYLDRSVWLIEAIVGCHLAGTAYVPLDPSYPQARTRDVLEDADVATVLTTSLLGVRLPKGRWSTLDVDLLEEDSSWAAAPPDVAPETPAYILYTSGSTGCPKGVVVSHGNLKASTEARLQVYETPPKRFLLLPSVAFDSSVAGIFWTLGVGGTLVIPTDDEARDPRRLTKLVGRERVTSLLCVPSLYGQLLKSDDGQLQDLKTVIVAGESCSSQLVEDHFRCAPHARLFNEYGPTEATVWATVHEVTEEDATRPVAIGRPIPGVRIDVLDGFGRPVPAGIPGNAWISGPTVAQGYWRRPDLTAERFSWDAVPETAECSYQTGDRVKWTEDGRLLFLGRDDEQIKLRGFRIEPGDIEAALLESLEISDVAVVACALGSTTPKVLGAGSTRLVAFVEATASDNLTSWRQDLTRLLPGFMIPDRLVSLPELPRLPNRKIDRQRLRSMVLEPEAHADEQRTVLDARAQTLISLWEGLLARTGIGLDDNFFELGGHSLLIVEMTLAIERDLEVDLTAADVFENPTLRQLTRRIAQRGGPVAPPYQHLFPIQPLGRKAPFIVAVPHFFTDMFAQRFREERPVYGLRGVSLRPEGNLGRWRTMKDLGDDLVDEIERRFRGSTCIVAGYSFGASMAFETVRIMEERGIPVHRLYLIAPMAEDFYRLGPWRIQLDGLRQPVTELSATEALRLYVRSNNPLTRRPYQRVWRWFAIEPWRRLLCGVGRLRKLFGLPLTSRVLYADVRVDRFRLHAAYRPEPIRTPTVVFNAQEPETDAAATWRPHFQGPYTVYPIPDPHLGDTSVQAARQIILQHLGDMEDS